MKSVVMIMVTMLLTLLAPATLESVNDWRSREYTEPHIVVTGGAATTADVVLVNDLFSDATANAVVTSSDADDAPYPSAYVPASNTLTISGLAISTTRTLSVVYRIDGLSDYLGVSLASRVFPALLLLGIIGLIGGAIYQATRRGE
jgi:hypothetical protein